MTLAATLAATLAELGSPPAQRDGIVRRILDHVDDGLGLAEAIERIASAYGLPRSVRAVLGHVALSEPATVELSETDGDGASLDALERDMVAAGVDARTRDGVLATVRRERESADAVIARLRASGVLPALPEPEDDPVADAELEAKLPAGLSDDDRAEVLRIARDHRESR